MVTYASLNLKLFGLVNKKKPKFPKFSCTLITLLNKSPKYEENYACVNARCIRENACEQLCTILQNHGCIDECKDGQTNGIGRSHDKLIN